MGVTKPRVAGSGAHYSSSCLYAYPVLDGTGNSMKRTACLTVGLWPKWLCRWAGVPSVLLIKPQWLALSVAELKVTADHVTCLFSPPVVLDSFLERYLWSKNSTRTAGLVKYSWSQRCILKWMDKCIQHCQDATSARQTLRLLVLGC